VRKICAMLEAMEVVQRRSLDVEDIIDSEREYVEAEEYVGENVA
jgi:hypothetical protein